VLGALFLAEREYTGASLERVIPTRLSRAVGVGRARTRAGKSRRPKMVEFLRDAGLSDLLATGAELETLADGFVFTEGPLWTPDGSILVQDIKAEATYRLRRGWRPELVRDNTRAANGQTFSADGRVIFCEQNGRRVSRMSLDGTGVEPIAETWQGQRLNSPNDIVCRSSDGRAFFSDPPYGVAPGDRGLHFQGVYSVDPCTGQGLRLVADDFEKPNGLAFSADERTLYVCDTARYHVRAFSVEASGEVAVGSSRIFATLDPAQPGGPDGLKVDHDGRVYIAVAQGIWVFESSGRLLGILATPRRPSNLAWCGPDGSTLAITAVDAVHLVNLRVAGIMPPFTPSVLPKARD
jgi:gluconolactonase